MVAGCRFRLSLITYTLQWQCSLSKVWGLQTPGPERAAFKKFCQHKTAACFAAFSFSGKGGGSSFGEDPGGYRTWGFCNLMWDRFLDFPGFRLYVLLKLMFYQRYWKCVIVGEPKWEFSIGEGDGSIIGVDPDEYYTWGFCKLAVNSGMRIGPNGGLGC